jgi:hypothetical protein
MEVEPYRKEMRARDEGNESERVGPDPILPREHVGDFMLTFEDAARERR